MDKRPASRDALKGRPGDAIMPKLRADYTRELQFDGDEVIVPCIDVDTEVEISIRMSSKDFTEFLLQGCEIEITPKCKIH